MKTQSVSNIPGKMTANVSPIGLPQCGLLLNISLIRTAVISSKPSIGVNRNRRMLVASTTRHVMREANFKCRQTMVMSTFVE